MPSETPGRAATYGRQSRERADESAASPQAQREQTAAFVSARGWTHLGHYEDVGLSGYDPRVERPQLKALMTRVHAREIDHVVVYRLDRLTRRGVVEAARLVGELAEHGAALASVQEPFLDTSSPMGRGIFSLFAALAEQESANISSRTRGTKAVLRRAGSWSGGNPPYGTRTTRVFRDGLNLLQLEAVPEEAAVMADVVRRVLAGASVGSEARRLNEEGTPTKLRGEWSTSTLSRTLRSPALAGYLPERHRRADSGHFDVVPARDEAGELLSVGAPIVAPSDWWELQAVITERGGGRGPRPNPTLLGSFDPFVCGACGGRMAGDRRAGGRGTYRCVNHRNGSTLCTGATVSMQHTDDYVVSAVWERLRDLDEADPLDATQLRAVAARYRDQSARAEDDVTTRVAEATLADAEMGLLRLDDDRMAGVFDGPTGTERYRRQVASLTSRAASARASLSVASEAQDDGMEGLLEVLTALRHDDLGHDDPDSPWQAWTPVERRDFLTLFLDRVEVLQVEERRSTRSWNGADRIRLRWVGEAPFSVPMNYGE